MVEPHGNPHTNACSSDHFPAFQGHLQTPLSSAMTSCTPIKANVTHSISARQLTRFLQTLIGATKAGAEVQKRTNTRAPDEQFRQLLTYKFKYELHVQTAFEGTANTEACAQETACSKDWLIASGGCVLPIAPGRLKSSHAVQAQRFMKIIPRAIRHEETT